MSEHEVHVEWGPFLSSCYISLMDGEKFGPTLHISDDMFGDKKVKASELMPSLVKYDKSRVPLSEIMQFLPNKNEISWTDELKGDALLGYEIRGMGDGFRAWVQDFCKDHKGALDEQQKAEILEKLIGARSTFFP